MITKKLPDGKTVNAYPFNSSQLMMFLASLKYGSGYPVNNIGCGLYWKGEFDTETMKASIYEAIERCDTMRLRFAADRKKLAVQYITEKSELKVEEWDYSSMTVEQAEDKLTEISRSNIPMFNCEVHRIAIVTFADGYKGLFMKLHHLAMDAYSLKVFTNDIIEIYLHKTKGLPYPKPMKPYIPQIEKDLAYKNTPQYEEDKKFWFDTIAKTSEPIFTDFMLENRLKKQQLKNPSQRFADIHSGLPDATAQKISMDSDTSNSILNMCSEKNLSVYSVITACIRTALSCFNDNQEDVSFKMILNRRATLSEKKSGGLRINFVPVRSIIKPEETFTDAVNRITEIQNEIYLHSELSFFDILKERHKSMPKESKSDSTYESFALSYQPPVNAAVIDEQMAQTVKSIWYNNGATMIPLYLTILHRRNDNGLDFVFEYRKTSDADYDISVLCSKIFKIFSLVSQNPQIKISEILNQIIITSEERNGKPQCQHSKNWLSSLKTMLKLTRSRAKTILSLISA